MHLAMLPVGILEWHSLIFLLPFAVSALLFLLSSLNLGHFTGKAGAHGHSHVGHGGHTTHAHGHAAPSTAHGHHTPHPAHAAPASHRAHAGPDKRQQGHPERTGPDAARSPIPMILGFGRALISLVIESFFICWGLCGFWANRLLVDGHAAPGAGVYLPSIGIALVGGLVGARGAAAILSRVLPRDESSVVSRHELFGSIGEVTFAVSESGGRVHIYDNHGTLHDESCRVAAGRPPVPRGRRVMVVDVDEQGRLLVEETDATA